MSFPQVALSTVAEVNPRFDHPASRDLDERVSFVPMANVSETRGTITKEEERSLANVLKGFTPFVERDVLLAKITPCFENGKIAHARIKKRFGFGSTEFHVIRAQTATLDDRYIYQYLRTPSVRAEGVRRMTGSAGQKRVPKAFLDALLIPLPSLHEQRRIAAVLDKADALRVQRRAAIAKLDELLQSVFIEMFGDPVMNPMGWPMVSVGEVTNSRLGKMLDKKTSQGDHMRPYLANMNVQWGRFELGNLRQMNFSLEDQEEFSLRSGDILMCEGGEPGRCAIWKAQFGDCYYQKALHRIRCDPDKSIPEYIQWLFWFLAKAGAFRSSIAVATIAHLPGIKLKKLEIPLPPVDRQQYFSRIVEKIEAQKQAMQLAVDKAETLFASLQQRAFSGKL